MDRRQAENAKFCEALVRAQDEDRWRAARYAPPPARARLLALYALAAEIEQAPARVSEAPLGEIRLQWWREALDEVASGGTPRQHPVLAALAGAGFDAGARDLFSAAVDARARLLYPPAFSSVRAFADWSEAIEGGVAATAWRLLAGGDGDGEKAEAARRAAVAYRIARDARRLAPDFAGDALALAGDMNLAARAALGAIPIEAMPAIAHCALTPAWIRSAAPGPIARRLIIFRAVASGRL